MSEISVTLVDWSQPKLYATGYFDPPWWESGGGKCKRGADRHYPLMKTPAICALPVAKLFAPNAHLYLWATNNHLPDALEVMNAWGFRYVTMITWGKCVTFENAPPAIQTGLGQYFRGSSEHLLFGVRGKVPYKVNWGTGKRQQGRTLYLEPRGEHSEKPERFREVIEHVSKGPYLEGFARRKVAGWDSWGNEVASDIELR